MPLLDIESCYRRYGPMVLRRCRRLLRDEEKALDAMHDVFVNLARRVEMLNDDAPGALLFRMATHACLNRLRDEGRHATEPVGDEVLARIARANDGEERSAARALLARLWGREQESTRVMAVLHFVDGMTLDEVAREVGLSVSGVRKRLRTLRAHVKELEGV
ncbi:MAG: sigma-70 family RNA polymerase sigma factor [Pseudomonadota bacterium]